MQDIKHETMEIGRFKINLPINLPKVLNTPVRDSYQDFLQGSTKDVRRHLTAVCSLLPPVITDTKAKNFLHAFGGVGATAQVIDQVHPAAHHTFWDRDPILVEYLTEWRPDNVKLVPNSFVEFLSMTKQELNYYDALLMDMSVGTIKTDGVKAMWAAIGQWMRPDTFAWFTDTACHKIHLNYKTYAKDFNRDIAPTAEDYLAAYSEWLTREHGLVITSAMREAGEFYCVVRSSGHQRFSTIPYL